MKPTRRRWKLRYPLKTLLVSAAVISIVVVLGALRLRTVNALRSKNDGIRYLQSRGEVRIVPPTGTSKSWYRQFRDALLGDSDRSTVDSVFLDLDEIHEEDVRQLSQIAPLRGTVVSLHVEQLTATDAERLSRCARVVDVEFDGLRAIQGNVGAYFRRMKRVSHLAFSNTSVCLQPFGQFPAVTSVGLSKRIGHVGESLREVAGFPNLEELSLCDIRGLSAADMDAVWGLDGLKVLRLAGLPALRRKGSLLGVATLSSLEVFSAVVYSADVIPALTILPHLREVVLRGPAITDEVIPMLGEMRQLTLVDVQMTPVTDDGIRRLRAILPDCRIRWSPLPKPDIILNFTSWTEWRIHAPGESVNGVQHRSRDMLVRVLGSLAGRSRHLEIVWDIRLSPEKVYDLEEDFTDILSTTAGFKSISFR